MLSQSIMQRKGKEKGNRESSVYFMPTAYMAHQAKSAMRGELSFHFAPSLGYHLCPHVAVIYLPRSRSERQAKASERLQDGKSSCKAGRMLLAQFSAMTKSSRFQTASRDLSCSNLSKERHIHIV